MRYLLPLVVFILTCRLPLSAQGFSAPWDISKTAGALALQAAKLTPLLDQMKPSDWQAKGAPDAYAAQAKSAREEAGYLEDSAAAFVKQPEKLSLAIATYFRMQSVEKIVDSLADAVRRYQDQRLGDEIVTVLAANFTNRDMLRQYISDLAVTREDEFKVIDSEAQRCRGSLVLRQPPQTGTARKAMAK
jgi:hypothetical protein